MLFGTCATTAVIAKERETLKTLAYDCGNPVQYVCGQTPAVLFYLLDRHAPLAMTKGSNSPSTHHSYHSCARGPHKHIRVCGVDKAGILYLFSNNFCHSRVGGNRAWVVVSYLIEEIILCCVFIYL